MSIQLITYANQTVAPLNDAIIYENAIGQNGIFNGCDVTVSTNQVNISGGYGIICGREFVVESESISVTLAGSGTLKGRLYARLDLSDPSTPIQLLTATGSTLPPLTQEDGVNYNNGVYEMELATFTVGVDALSDVVETFQTITPSVSQNQVQAGEISPTSVSGNSFVDIPVTFPTPFYKKPAVVVGFNSYSDSPTIGAMEVAAFGISVNGFTCRIFNSGTSTRIPGVEWIAVSV